jgi:hypothetical protein
MLSSKEGRTSLFLMLGVGGVFTFGEVSGILEVVANNEEGITPKNVAAEEILNIRVIKIITIQRIRIFLFLHTEKQ